MSISDDLFVLAKAETSSLEVSAFFWGRRPFLGPALRSRGPQGQTKAHRAAGPSRPASGVA
ncbi:hypothetical protein SGRA_0889 [Saprospira grandis str. Lewin]|uniref:Uncharacterized protein n=1 Tax=Saprospira grandis (strain Lewin) TaxID=984262 RepID=H6L2G7_SAPGL|nr:hypothetical protein SGRA_0889 [Saprospira grandis str. Lewin]